MTKVTATKTTDPQKSNDLAEPLVSLVVFKLQNDNFAVPIRKIKEVTSTPPVNHVPQSVSYIEGISNIRGNLVTIFDLEQRLRLEASKESETNKSYTIVVEKEEYGAGFIVRHVPYTLNVPESSVDRGVEVLQNSSLDSSFIHGIVKFDEDLIIILNLDTIMKI